MQQFVANRLFKADILRTEPLHRGKAITSTTIRQQTGQGEFLFDVMSELFPVMRSIAGPGVRRSLSILQKITPINIHEVPSGEAVFDWAVPNEWHFTEAWIDDNRGNRLVDTASSNLHLVNYSSPVDGLYSLEDLLPHLHSLPEQPDCIPYRTSYYAENWGFCLTHRTLNSLGDGPFQVKIDTKHLPGVLNYGEILIPGKRKQEILVSTHICHPQLANDNLTGMVLAAAMADALRKKTPELSWRIVFVPGTIGAITWLSQNQYRLQQIVGGLVLTGLGDASQFHWKKTRDGCAWIDTLVAQVLAECAPQNHCLLPFSPYGYDERQYASPGFSLPVGRLTRAVHGTFPEYHTSDDNLDFVSAEKLEESITLLLNIADSANHDLVYRNLSPFGEPQLGRRGLYASLGAATDPGKLQMSLLWILNQSDGKTPLSSISARSRIPLMELHRAAQILVEKQLLEVTTHACHLTVDENSGNPS